MFNYFKDTTINTLTCYIIYGMIYIIYWFHCNVFIFDFFLEFLKPTLYPLL